MRGYIYVLVNSSLPGLVKVGKTTRLPSDRADELSGSTGVPTPFIIAFEQLFENCHTAERYIHAALADRGTRLSANREFFTAKPVDVIKIIMATPDLLDAASLNLSKLDVEELPLASGDPWGNLLDQAACYHYGTHGKLQDYRRAFQLYARASSIGSAEAFEKMGIFLLRGHGIKANPEKAKECFEQSIELGNFYAYAKLASSWLRTDHRENFSKCWKALVEARKDYIRDKGQIADERPKYITRLADLLLECNFSDIPVPVEIIKFAPGIKTRIEYLKAECERAPGEIRDDQANNYSVHQYELVLKNLSRYTNSKILAGLDRK